MASGIYIYFLHLITNEERIEQFDNNEKGEGASCLAGHPVVPMFCMSERRENPRIFIYTFPELRSISICTRNGTTKYLSSCFAGTEYILTLTSLPDFLIILWHWKSGDLLVAVKTKVNDELQKVRCSPTSPLLASQFSATSGSLSVYEITVCSKMANLLPVEIKPFKNKLTSVSWSQEGSLIICDEFRNIFVMRGEDKKRLHVVTSMISERSKRPLSIIAHQNGVIMADNKITFYRKSTMESPKEMNWLPSWTIESISYPTIMAVHPDRNGILVYGEMGELFEIDMNEENVPIVNVKCDLGGSFEAISWIFPGFQHAITLDKFDRLKVIDTSTGQFVGELHLHEYDRVLCIVPHPTLPLITATTVSGYCLFISVFNVTEPIILNLVHLNAEPLNKAKFINNGTLFGVATKNTGDVFFLGDDNNGDAIVVGRLITNGRIVDFLSFQKDADTLKVLILPATNSGFSVGNVIIIYTINIENFSATANHAIQLPQFYKSLHFHPNGSFEFLGVPFLTRQLHVMSLYNYRSIALVKATSSVHQLKMFRVIASEHQIITCGYDGLVIIRDTNDIDKVIARLMPHHRSEGGAKCAIATSSLEIILSVGNNGSLVATKLCSKSNIGVSELFPMKLNLKEIQKMICSLTKTDLEKIQREKSSTWVERREMEKLRREREEAAVERAAILEKLKMIKEKIVTMLDQNEKESEMSKLPISNFDLNEESRRRKLINNKIKQEEEERNLEELIIKQDGLAEFLKNYCWNRMQVHCCLLKAIHEDAYVQNFPLAKISIEKEDRQIWNEFLLTLSRKVSRIDSDFLLPEYKEETNDTRKSEKHNLRSLTVPEKDEINYIDYEIEKEEYDKVISLIGTSTYKWIKDEYLYFAYKSFEIGNFTTGAIDNSTVTNKKHQLKKYFNKLFEGMKTKKKEVLSLAVERINKLEHCKSELMNMFAINFPAELSVDSAWSFIEIPDYIIIVNDEEIPVKPFLEKQETSVKTDEDEELINFLNKSYDFREQALQIMMEGVIEPRWEDEIKKDIPIPECMINKDPSEFTPEDNEATILYEQKVEQLKAEREKYKSLLQESAKNLEEAFNKDIGSFDERLHEFSITRMKVKSAILQESLKKLRISRRHLSRVEGDKVISKFQEKLSLTTKRSQELAEYLASLEVPVNDLKNRFQSLKKREKLLESKFRGEFFGLKTPLVGHLLRHYKKRPKSVRLVCTSVTYLTETIRCLNNGEESDILPRDCLEFLRGMEILSEMPRNLPTQILDRHWSLMCRLRKQKIEMEIKIMVCAIELAEAEQTLTMYRKLQMAAENNATGLMDLINNQIIVNDRSLDDAEVQVILKIGRIEVESRGRRLDLKNALLVTAEELTRVNDAILDTARRKLEAMNKTLYFRRAVYYEEWRHQCMQIKVKDLKDRLQTLRSVKMFYRILGREKSQLEKMADEISEWQERNICLFEEIERSRSINFEMSLQCREESRVKKEAFESSKIKAIMKRNKMARKVEDNYEDLLELQARLELLRLRTYPTLRFKLDQ
ncbi:cilia- and flagella-associated protein 43 isoform X2 [Orussus abietinus]|uniref:cilia- and flagella-associated protein 43 isoform X2 n=1 Tax=Orussus abietinus TaxID=222816 RepID=UPI0006265BDD|nr:cilia- and flagella-associated protein 43 isoform X2 [Orussus abietinus]